MLDQSGIIRLKDVPKESDFAYLRQALARAPTGQPVFAREINIEVAGAAFTAAGKMDFAIVLWHAGRPRLRIVETKASRRDKTYHRIQIATYRLILDHLLRKDPLIVAGLPIGPRDVEYSVARLDEKTNSLQDLLATPSLALDQEVADLKQKLRSGGEIERIASTPPDQLPYCLDSKCDDCQFDVRCMTESARGRRPELLGLPPSTIKLLSDNGLERIDDIARLDLNSDTATRLRQSEGLRVDLGQMTEMAKARRATLPRGEGDPDNFQVRPLPHVPIGQLPEHFPDGAEPLVRVYVQVDYDYVENRVGAITSHVTHSPLHLSTSFAPKSDGNGREPVAGISQLQAKRPQPNAPAADDFEDAMDHWLQSRAGPVPDPGLGGPTIVHLKREQWSGNPDEDTRAEAALIDSFFTDTVTALREVAKTDSARIHFYFYSRSEITRLIEACSRCGDQQLMALADLLGCRQNSEQMIFSCVQDEITSRFALGWTSQSLAVAASLNWYGQSFHWVREVDGKVQDLSRLFDRDVFDFKTSLPYDPDRESWIDDPHADPRRTRFEIRSRNTDSLKAPYLRAAWGTLPRDEDFEGLKPGIRTKLTNDLKKFREAGKIGIIEAYLAARVHALRWLEERIQHKNRSIDKTALNLNELHSFDLPENSTFESARVFLRVDQTVKRNDWLRAHLVPPAVRIQAGDTLPIREITVAENGSLTAKMDLAPHGISPADFSRRSSIGEGSFIRLSERPAQPYTGQTTRMLEKSGSTCRITSVDWDAGTISLAPIPNFLDGLYQPLSHVWKAKEGPRFSYATLDQSIADFVAGHVEQRLLSGIGNHVGRWFDSENPEIPPLPPADPGRMQFAETAIANWPLPGAGLTLSEDQASAVRDGLSSRVQLIKGPPGTGKTATTAAAILVRAATLHADGDVILVAANTHRAVDTLLERLSDYRAAFSGFSKHNGGPADFRLEMGRIHGRGEQRDLPRGAERIVADTPSKKLAAMRARGVTVIAGTTAGMLKFVAALNDTAAYQSEPFAAHSLVVDEASMLVFPHFLALASLVREDGTIVLAGDDLQLSPIISNDWDKEDRPPTRHYQTFLSAYKSIANLARGAGLPKNALRESSLTMTFRLPSDVRRLIEGIYRTHDGIELKSRADDAPATKRLSHLSEILRCDVPVIAVIHEEASSRNYNEFEAELLRQMIGSGAGLEPRSVAIITPHRAQRALLNSTLGAHPCIAGAIDTVERFQGGEQDTVIVAGTESDPYAIGAASDFILNLNRANVAFSRAKKKLVVVVARTLLDHIPPELESYHSAVLWKTLRGMCSMELMRGTLEGCSFRVLTLKGSDDA
ncbi:AAA domain-containing protein [Bradyrhizobium sp. USDA 4350]